MKQRGLQIVFLMCKTPNPSIRIDKNIYTYTLIRSIEFSHFFPTLGRKKRKLTGWQEGPGSGQCSDVRSQNLGTLSLGFLVCKMG